MVDQFLSITEAGNRLGWSRRMVLAALKRHGVGTIGTNRRARITEADFARLVAAERQPVAPLISAEQPIVRQLAGSSKAWEMRRLLADIRRKWRD